MSENVLRRIQNEVGEWAAAQFGANVSKWTGQTLGSLLPLLGMLEEVGELCHVTGYRHSGRGFTTEEEYQAAIKDGLADLFVFACDYAEREGIKLDEGLQEVWEKVKLRRQSKWLEDKAKEENRNREEEMKAALSKDCSTGPRVIPEQPITLIGSIERCQYCGKRATWTGKDWIHLPDEEYEKMVDHLKPPREQTGQGFAEPPEELPPETFFTKEQIDKALEGQDSFAMKDFKGFPPALGSEEFYQSMGVPPEVFEGSLPRPVSNPVDPPYLYGKSRDARTGTNSVGKGVIEQLKQDPEPEDGWTVARKIANTFVDGQNLAYALKSIDSFEEQWKKEHRLRTKKLGQLIYESFHDRQFSHGDLEGKEIQQYEKAAAKLLELRAVYVDLGEQQRLALTGKLAIAALGLDPDNTSPKDVEEEIINLVAFKSDCNPADEE